MQRSNNFASTNWFTLFDTVAMAMGAVVHQWSCKIRNDRIQSVDQLVHVLLFSVAGL
jgi:hypothetical protein